MKTATSLLTSVLLGTVAGFAVAAGARAADMGDKAEPVQFVKICSLDGHTYYYIPGNDACTKNGLSLTIGTDERRSKSLMSLSTGSAPKIGSQPTDRQSEVWPDPFISLRSDQAWGYGALVAGAHNINGAYTGDNSVLGAANGFNACLQTGASDCGRLVDKGGFFVGLGGEVKLPMLGPGDRIGAGVRYSQSTSTGFGGVLNMSGPDLFGAASNPAVGWMPDSGSGLELTKAWSVQAGYDHQWSHSLNTSLFAGYSNVTFDGQSASSFAGATCPGGANAPSGAGGNCKSNWGNVGAGLRTSWAPASGLTLSVQTMYNNVFGGTPAARPTDAYNFANQGVWSSYLRIDHSFNTAN
ncbi:MAG TPA: porin [Xanthobacteraceae bacterium]